MTDAWDGRPQNPERDGRHWCLSPEGEPTLCTWFAEDGFWHGMGWSSPTSNARRGWRYLGPALLPAEVEAAKALAAWSAFDDVLAWINTGTEQFIDKKDLYRAVMEMRPKSDALAADRKRVRREALEEAARFFEDAAREAFAPPDAMGAGDIDHGCNMQKAAEIIRALIGGDDAA